MRRQLLSALLFSPVAKHVGRDACTINPTGRLFSHKLVEHLLWYDCAKVEAAKRWPASSGWLRVRWLLLLNFRHAFNQ
jgi:hypothetical protein